MPVPTRALGRNGPQVSRIGLGCMGMSAFYGPSDEEQNLATLRRAIELGCTFWDTSDVYAAGKNEELLAKVINEPGNREKLFIATKFGFKMTPTGAVISGAPEYAKECCENSLKRLGVSTIDLFYLHVADPNTPIEDTMKALVELKEAGKIRYIGLSNISAAELRKAHAVHPVTALQMEYSPWTLDIEENGLLETARELGVAIVCYSPLGRGFLTGQIKSTDDFAPDDFRRNLARFKGENFQKNLDVVAEFEKLAAKRGVKSSQLCLSWVLSRGDDIFPIPGTRSADRLAENLASADVKLTEEEKNEVNEILKNISGTKDY
jgi:aryl-alcohol dehydrogenase-like predicted oxidoreductase